MKNNFKSRFLKNHRSKVRKMIVCRLLAYGVPNTPLHTLLTYINTNLHYLWQISKYNDTEYAKAGYLINN